MKKVAHLLYSGLGGHGSVFFSLAKADVNKEFQLEAVFCGVEPVRKDYVDQCQELEIPYQFIQKKPGFDPVTYFKVYKAFRKAGAGVIFLHGASFILPALMYKTFNPRVKLVLRDTQAHHLKSKMDWVWLKLAARKVNSLVFLTQEGMELIEKRLSGIPIQRKSVVIPNGLDTDLYSVAPGRDISTKVVIGMQSRLQKIKDHPTLFKAIAILKEKTNRQITLRIAGDGETMQELKDLVNQLNITEQVEFCGMLPEKDLVSFMHSLDIYVHATYGEMMSNSIMQALSCGLPVIASDVWGVNKMINDGENGLLYASEDADILASHMLSLINENEKRQRLSANARSYALDKLSHYRMYNNYKNILL